jgi:hypothetical protein
LQKALLEAVLELADADEDAAADARVGGARRSAAATAAAPAAAPTPGRRLRSAGGAANPSGASPIDLSHAEAYAPKFV